ncbi:hypothetical protein TRFO_22123 [Tritrichomonas foetus]|uniref:Uncharacterized protein n=1 Tax=Tritrichomonas foetus TaxID=1144522 RepID=A0A1J4KCG9_9EUKA|nr:hypothetical protein TRFO_22123 [Tritrichomonas foetus]|eukprot:OHT09119.1 hypothetical protein TRFO_22123 [Tritrichomonas foetus]
MNIFYSPNPKITSAKRPRRVARFVCPAMMLPPQGNISPSHAQITNFQNAPNIQPMPPKFNYCQFSDTISSRPPSSPSPIEMNHFYAMRDPKHAHYKDGETKCSNTQLGMSNSQKADLDQSIFEMDRQKPEHGTNSNHQIDRILHDKVPGSFGIVGKGNLPSIYYSHGKIVVSYS